MKRFRCFVFDLSLLKLRSSNTSKPKRTVTPFYVYVSNPPMPYWDFRHCIDFTKVMVLFENSIVVVTN